MFTIYTLGDVEIFRQVLNAVAMVFGSGILSSGSGIGAGSAIAAGLLITLMLSLMSGALSFFGMARQFNPGIVIVLLVIYVGMAVPKVSVQVEDLYTGTATTVDNIPVGLALPAALISTITKSVTEKIETAFSTVDGNYISMTSQGFANPLNILLALRNGVEGFDPYLVANIKAFTLDCIPGSSTFDQKAFSRAPNAIDYLTTNYRDGLTVTFSPAVPQGTAVPCNQAAANINNDTTNFLGGADFAQLINSKMPSRATPNTSTPGTYTATDVNDTYEKLIKPVWGAAQDANGFMKNALLSNTISNAFNCAAANTTYASFNQCEITLTQAAEQWKTDAAGQAGFFNNMMIPGMNILLAMFYAFSPLVFIFATMSSWHGIHILKNYLQFGAWTQTWLPFAAIINFMIQLMVSGELNRMKSASANGLTLVVSNDYYRLLSTKLAMASDMLASVPIVSFALLTGGAYAMTQIAGKWSGRDYVDEKQASPDILKQAPMMATGGIASQSTAEFSHLPGVGWRTNTGLAGASLATVSTSNLRQAALSNVDAQTESYATQAGVALGHGVQKMTGTGSSYEAFKSLGNEFSTGHDEVSKATQQMASKLDLVNKYGVDRAKTIQGLLGANISLGLPGVVGIKAGVEQSKQFTEKETQDITNGYSQLMSRDHSVSNMVKSAHSSNDGKRWASTITSGMSTTDSKQFNEAKTHMNNLSKTRQSLESSTENLGMSQSMDVQRLHALLGSRDGGTAALGATLSSAVEQHGLGGKVASIASNPAFAREVVDPGERLQMAQLTALSQSPGAAYSTYAGIIGGAFSMPVTSAGNNLVAPQGVDGAMEAGRKLDGDAHGAVSNNEKLGQPDAGRYSGAKPGTSRGSHSPGRSSAPAGSAGPADLAMPSAPASGDVKGAFDGQFESRRTNLDKKWWG